MVELDAVEYSKAALEIYEGAIFLHQGDTCVIGV